MVTVVTATDFHGRDDRPDWRYALGRIEAWYRCDTFEAAAALASEIAAAAERAGHHPDLDVRYPDWLHVVLTTHAVDAVTNLDVDLAGEITALAATFGAVSAPRAVQALEVAIDAMDIDAVRPFWKAVLDYDDALARPDGTVVAIVDRLRVGPAFWFQQMEEPRPSATASTSTSPSPTTSQRLGSQPHWRQAAHWSAIGRLGPSGSSPTPKAMRPASVPGRTATEAMSGRRGGVIASE